MTLQSGLLWIIVGCALVTWIPRIIPFLVVRNVRLPRPVLKWLSYIPVCILSALVIGALLKPQGTVVTVDRLSFLAFVPTLIAAVWTRSLSVTVIAGVVTMALIRWIAA